MVEFSYSIGVQTHIRACYLNKLYEALMWEDTPYEMYVTHSQKGKQFRFIVIFCNAEHKDYFAKILHNLEDVEL